MHFFLLDELGSATVNGLEAKMRRTPTGYARMKTENETLGCAENHKLALRPVCRGFEPIGAHQVFDFMDARGITL
jgi:hypothetical protein